MNAVAACLLDGVAAGGGPPDLDTVPAMDLPLFDTVAAFVDARLDDESANPTGRYAMRAEAFKDIQAKVRLMNRACDARDLAASFPDDTSARAMLTAYDAVIRHLAEVYDTHPDYQHYWRPEGEEIL